MTTVETVFFVIGLWLAILLAVLLLWVSLEELVHYLRRRRWL